MIINLYIIEVKMEMSLGKMWSEMFNNGSSGIVSANSPGEQRKGKRSTQMTC